ncbi:MAG: UbiA family prenyltransferase [Thermoplasmata archaeon]
MSSNVLKKFRGLMDVGRVQGVSLTALVSLLGAYSSTGGIRFIDWLAFIFIAFFAHSSGAAVNEYMDIELDSMVPELSKKPLVSGVLSPKGVLAYIVTAFAISLVSVIIFFNWTALLIFVLSYAIIIGYNVFGKKIPAFNEFLFPLGYAVYLFFGAYAIGAPTALSFIMSASLFFATSFGQWLNSVKDADFDKRAGIKSFASLWKSGSDDPLTLRNPSLVLGLCIKALFLTLLSIPLLVGMFPPARFGFPIYLFIFVFICLPSQALIIKKLFGIRKREEFVKVMVLDTALSGIMGPIILIDVIGADNVLLLVLFLLVGYAIGSFVQSGAEFKFKRVSRH